MLRNSFKVFTVVCASWLLIACASIDERGNAAAGDNDKREAVSFPIRQNIPVSAPAEPVILKEQAVETERPRSTFDREREEELEEEEERIRHRDRHH